MRQLAEMIGEWGRGVGAQIQDRGGVPRRDGLEHRGDAVFEVEQLNGGSGPEHREGDAGGEGIKQEGECAAAGGGEHRAGAEDGETGGTWESCGDCLLREKLGAPIRLEGGRGGGGGGRKHCWQPIHGGGGEVHEDLGIFGCGGEVSGACDVHGEDVFRLGQRNGTGGVNDEVATGGEFGAPVWIPDVAAVEVGGSGTGGRVMEIKPHGGVPSRLEGPDHR